jgi:hypothetical protein
MVSTPACAATGASGDIGIAAAGSMGIIVNAQRAAAPISRKRFIWHFSLGRGCAVQDNVSALRKFPEFARRKFVVRVRRDLIYRNAVRLKSPML